MSTTDNQEQSEKKVVRRHRSDQIDYGTYVHKLQKVVAPEKNLSRGARTEINQILIHVAERLVEASRSLLRVQDKVTVAPETVRASCRIVLKSLGADVVADIDRALVTYDASSDVQDSKRRRIESRANLSFSVSRTRNLMRLGLCGRISKRSTVAMTAAIESVASLIIQAARVASDGAKKAIISTRHLRLAIGSNQGLVSLFSQIIFAGGVMPAEVTTTRKSKAVAKAPAKVPAKKSGGKKAVPAKAPAKKVSGKKAVPAKAPAKKVSGKKAVPAKAPAKKVSGKKVVPAKAPTPVKAVATTKGGKAPAKPQTTAKGVVAKK